MIDYQEYISYIESDYQERSKINAERVPYIVSKINDGIEDKETEEFKFKIISHLERNKWINSTMEEFIEKEKNTSSFISLFKIDPCKQGISEIHQKTFIELKYINYKLEILDKNSKSSFRLNEDGLICEGIRSEKNDAKSLDGKLFIDDVFFAYMVLKETHSYGLKKDQSGGNQKNQQNDASVIFSKNYNGKDIVIILYDGAYYNTKSKKTKLTKLEVLKNECNKNNIIITNSCLLEDDVNKYLNNKIINE
jgi:hypothetical protein